MSLRVSEDSVTLPNSHLPLVYVKNPTIENETKAIRTPFDLYMCGKNLLKSNVFIEFEENHSPSFDIVIKNISQRTLSNKEFEVAIVSEKYNDCKLNYPILSEVKKNDDYHTIETVRPPSGYYLHMVRMKDKKIFPDSYIQLSFSLYGLPKLKAGEESIIFVRIFMENNKQDYPITLKCVKKDSSLSKTQEVIYNNFSQNLQERILKK